MAGPILMPEAFAAPKGKSAKPQTEARKDDGAFENARRTAEKQSRTDQAREASRKDDKRAESREKKPDAAPDEKTANKAKTPEGPREKQGAERTEKAKKVENDGESPVADVAPGQGEQSGSVLPLVVTGNPQVQSLKPVDTTAEKALTGQVTKLVPTGPAMKPMEGLPETGKGQPVTPATTALTGKASGETGVQTGMNTQMLQQAGLTQGENGGKMKLDGADAMLEKVELARLGGLEGRSSTEEGPSTRRGWSDSGLAGLTQQIQARGGEVREQAMPQLKHYATSVDVPLSQAQWGEKVSGKIAWLANQGIQSAEIHINPPELGPVEVKVKVQNEQATVVMHAQNATVRDMLELNGHRLRDMLQEGGLELAQMDVSDQSSQEQAQQDGEEAGDGRGASGGSPLVSQDAGESVQTGELHLKLDGEVDIYA